MPKNLKMLIRVNVEYLNQRCYFIVSERFCYLVHKTSSQALRSFWKLFCSLTVELFYWVNIEEAKS